jgi:hypothetical protein
MISEIQKITFLLQYKRISMFLILLYTMSLATIVLIQIGLMHLSPKIFSTDMSILNNAHWFSKTCILFLDKILHFCAVDFCVVPGGGKCKYL